MRRKPVTCVLCHQDETRDEDAICGNCRRQWEDGALFDPALAVVGDKEVVPVNRYLRPDHYMGDPDAFARSPSVETELRCILMELTGAVEVSQISYRFASTRKPIGFYQRGFSDDGTTWWLMDHNKIDAIEKIVTFIRNWAAREYREGQRQGENFISKIARGELTVDEIDAQSSWGRAKGK